MSDLGPVDPGRGGETAWLRRWNLRADGDAFSTASSLLTPVTLADGTPAMLKVARSAEEMRGAHLLAAWDGRGAARVLRAQDAAVLLERATGRRALVAWAEDDRDDDATRVLCAAAATLHAGSDAVLPRRPAIELWPLDHWFRELIDRADDADGFHRRAAALATSLLADQREVVALHGDLHHGNVLDFGERGWLAIDPKGLVGDRAFDYCNLLCNPAHDRALAPGRLERQFAVVTDASGLEPQRLARWLVAWCALSSIWFAMDDDPALSASAAAIGERALTLL